MNFKIISILILVVVILSLIIAIRVFRESRNGFRIVKNIYYAGKVDKYRALDIYIPGCDKKYPVIFFVHGGAWSVGDKSHHTAKGLYFAKKGYVFVNVNYRLAPDVSYPDFAYDVAQALSWVYNHIGEYCGDNQKIYLMGHSAGGHLVALISYDEKFLNKYGLDASIVKGLILLDGGGYDIVNVYESYPVLYSLLFKKAFGEDLNILRDASPIYHLDEVEYVPPTLIIYTNWELTQVSAERLIDKLDSIGASFETFYAQGKTHDTVSRDIGKPGDETTEIILKFLKKLDENS